jgi:predicted PurR-regulated permease PerM
VTGVRTREPESVPLVVLRLAVLGLLLYCVVLVLYPFSSIILWSVALAVSLYPLYDRLLIPLRGRRRLAAVLITFLAFLLLALPAVWLAVTLTDSMRVLYGKIDFSSIRLLAVPDSIKAWPLIGEKLHSLWIFAIGNFGDVLVKLAPQLKVLAGVFLRVGVETARGLVSLLIAIAVMGCLFPSAPTIVGYMRAFARKLDPVRGEKFVELTGATIRGVGRGVVGISALQSVLAALGFVAAGLSQASLLACAVLIFGIVQIGAAFVIIPVIVWTWTFMDTAPAIVFTVYMVMVNSIDNVLKPFLLGRGLEAPILPILIGVIGGVLAFGIGGVFLGPVVVTVIWTLFLAWIDEPEESRPQ